MTKTNKIKIKKEIYHWAIKQSQKNFEEIENKFTNIQDWILQDSDPTFRQIQELANFLKVPLGYMFLDKPPQTSVIESEFRTIDNKIPNISKNLQDTIFNMSRKQAWISEHRRDKGWNKIIPKYFNDINKESKISFCKKAKEFMDLNEFWYIEIKEARDAYNFLRRKIEDKGIIVMQNGIVVSNTHRKLDVNEFRGFMIYDHLAPLIFINARDSQAGKIFTLIHEYIHILFEEEDIFISEDLKNENINEKNINEITAEFLMPQAHILKYWDQNEEEVIKIERLSKIFHVSKLALTIRLEQLGLVNQHVIDEIKLIMNVDLENKKASSKGGNYYTTYRSRYGDNFIKTVIQGAESGDISYTYAFNLLDAKAKTYDYFKEDIMSYE